MKIDSNLYVQVVEESSIVVMEEGVRSMDIVSILAGSIIGKLKRLLASS